MGGVAITLIQLIGLIATIIFWLVLIQFLISILVQFDILNPRQPFVSQVYRGISALLDPLLAPIRRVLPSAGGIDFSPMVLLIGLWFIQQLITNVLVAGL